MIRTLMLVVPLTLVLPHTGRAAPRAAEASVKSAGVLLRLSTSMEARASWTRLVCLRVERPVAKSRCSESISSISI